MKRRKVIFYTYNNCREYRLWIHSYFDGLNMTSICEICGNYYITYTWRAGDSATASLVVIQPGKEPMDINALITVYFLVNSLGHIHAT